jgi:hypothetical protein
MIRDHVGFVDDDDRPWDESMWSEYRIVCQDEKARHQPDRPTARSDVLSKASRMDDRECGPHRVQQRTIIRAVSPWSSLLDSDPQTELHEAVLAAARRFACPECPAAVDEDCLNLTLLRSRNERTPVKWPHAQRLDLVEGR